MKISGYNISGYILPSSGFLLDGVSDVAGAWSFRKLKITHTSYCLRLRRSSDNAETDVYFDADNKVSGSSVVSAGGDLTTWQGSDQLYLVTWYDQSGLSYNLIQPTASAQPEFILTAGAGGKPAIYSDGSSRGWMYNDSIRSIFSSTCFPLSSVCVYRSDSSGTIWVAGFNKGTTITNMTGLPMVNSQIYNNLYYRYDGGSIQSVLATNTAGLSKFRLGAMYFDTSSSYIEVSLIDTLLPLTQSNTGSITPGTHSSDRFIIGARQVSSGVISNILDGYIQEYILFNDVVSNFTKYRNDILTYYKT